MDNPRPRFTGIFIPAEILEMEELSPLDQMLISWIDALYCVDHGGCYASNEYLSKRLRVKENTIVKALCKLRKIGLIEDVAFNGRQRVIRAKIADYVEKSQSQADCDLNHRQGMTKITPRVGQKSQAPLKTYIYENKEEIKDKNIARTSQSESKQPADFYFCHERKEFVGIQEKDWKTWKQLYPCIDVNRETLLAIEWLRGNTSRSRKKNWRKFLTGWFSRSNEKNENQAAYRAARTGQGHSGEQFCAVIEENRKFAEEQIAKIPVDRRKLLGIASAFDDHARVKIGNSFTPIGYTENGFREQFINLLRKGGHI